MGIDYNKHCKLEFGEYVQTHEEHDNSLNPRTIGAIALRPTGNLQGSHFFSSLTSGKCIIQDNWTCIPMSNEFIEGVHFLAQTDKPTEIDEFNNQDLEEHEAMVAEEDDAELEADLTENNEHAVMRNEQISVNYNNFSEPMENNKEIVRSETERDDEILPHNSDGIDNENINIAPDRNTEVVAIMDLRYGSRTSHYDLHPRKPRD
jgi:hypothetical protein